MLVAEVKLQHQAVTVAGNLIPTSILVTPDVESQQERLYTIATSQRQMFLTQLAIARLRQDFFNQGFVQQPRIGRLFQVGNRALPANNLRQQENGAPIFAVVKRRFADRQTGQYFLCSFNVHNFIL